MKTLLIFALSVLATTSTPIRDETPEITSSINSFRSMIALQMNIGNMWKMEWYDYYVDKVKDRFKTCSDLSNTIPGTDHRFVLITDIATSERDMENLKNSDVQVAELMESGSMTSMGPLEMYHPRQNAVGCVAMSCNVDGRQIEGVCAIGPFGTFQLSDFWKGEPGCGCGGHRVDNGLCSLTSGKMLKFNEC